MDSSSKCNSICAEKKIHERRTVWLLCFTASETVCEENEALDYLSRLRECSLIVTEERGDQTRFRMLETLREYALDQLDASERITGEKRYCAYFVALAESAEPHLRGPEQAFYLEQLESEQDNFRAVLNWTLENDADAALRLSAALASFWETRGHYAEGRGWIEQALAKTQNASHKSSASTCSELERYRARALGGAGRFAWFGGDMVAASAHLEAGLELLRERNDVEGALDTLSSLILVLSWQGEEVRAIALVREGMALRERITDRAAALPTLSAFGWAIAFVVSPRVVEEGRAVNREVARLAREAGDGRSLGVALACLGGYFYWRAEWDEARAAYQESVPILREVGDYLMLPHALWGLGRVAVRQHRIEDAHALMQESLRWQIEAHNSPIGVPYTIEGCAQIAAIAQPARAVTLFATADRMRATQGARLQSLAATEIGKYLQDARATLGDEAFEAAWQRGRAMSSDEACDFALCEQGR